MDLLEPRNQIIQYDSDNDYQLEIYKDTGLSEEWLSEYLNAINLFHEHHSRTEFTVTQILNKYIGRYDNKNQFV